MQHHKKGILLVNLGSPDSTTVKDVRRYLREFLMDERVLDMPFLLRKFILECFILPKRPARSASAYRSIWWEEGSPLIVLSRQLKEALRNATGLPVELGMRYGNPSIEAATDRLLQKFPAMEEVLLIPLYPHYAMSSYETAVVRTQEVFKEKYPSVKLHVQPPFYEEEQYIEALLASMAPSLEAEYDHLLFSYHGIPERHLEKSDPTGQHCLCSQNCCTEISAAHATCYRHQVFRTTSKLAEKLSLEEGKYSVSFQSRLGRDPWLTPFTDLEVKRLAEEGVRKLVVVCPSFVSDCLETLEEIGKEAKHIFLEAGGEQFTLIPCLNVHPLWVRTIANWSRQFAGREMEWEEAGS